MNEKEFNREVLRQLYEAGREVFATVENLAAGTYTARELGDRKQGKEPFSYDTPDALQEITITQGEFCCRVQRQHIFHVIDGWEKLCRVGAKKITFTRKDAEQEDVVLRFKISGLSRDIKQLAKFVSSDPNRPEMANIFLDVENRALVATNGNMMQSFTISVSEVDGERGRLPLFIRPDVLKHLSYSCNVAVHKRGDEYDTELTCDDGRTFRSGFTSECYPDWKSVVPTKPGGEVVFTDCKAVSAFLKQKKDGSDWVQMSIERGRSKAVLKINDVDYGRELVAVCPLESPATFSMTVVFSRKQLLAVVQSGWDGMVNLYDCKSRPAYFSTYMSLTLLMPAINHPASCGSLPQETQAQESSDKPSAPQKPSVSIRTKSGRPLREDFSFFEIQALKYALKTIDPLLGKTTFTFGRSKEEFRVVFFDENYIELYRVKTNKPLCAYIVTAKTEQPPAKQKQQPKTVPPVPRGTAGTVGTKETPVSDIHGINTAGKRTPATPFAPHSSHQVAAVGKRPRPLPRISPPLLGGRTVHTMPVRPYITSAHALCAALTHRAARPPPHQRRITKPPHITQHRKNMCKIYSYIRFSTDAQDEQSQKNIINGYLAKTGVKIDKEFRDEGVSGGVSYKERHLSGLLAEMQAGDTLIVSELSRLTRGGIVELSDIITNYFKPRKVRLIIVNVGLDIDCTELSPMTELQLAMMATFAKIEKEHIRQRTRSAIEARKAQLREQGFFISKSGNRCTRLGSAKGVDTRRATDASAVARRERARQNPTNKIVWGMFADFQDTPTSADFSRIAARLGAMGVKTSTGLAFTTPRARAAYHNLKKVYRQQPAAAQ